MKKLILSALVAVAAMACGQQRQVLFSDNFSEYELGPVMPHVGPHTEYHYVSAAEPKGPWVVTAFQARKMDTAWKARMVGDVKVMSMTVPGTSKHSHPMLLVNREGFWQNYTAEVKVAPQELRARTGVVFRYHNDRCNYYFGMEGKGKKVVMLRVEHETDFHVPNEMVLAEAEYAWNQGEVYTLTVDVNGTEFVGSINGVEVLRASDDRWTEGQIALVSDNLADYYDVTVTADKAEIKRIAARKKAVADEEALLQAENPKMTLWKKIETPEFGTGRNLRFGDLTGNGTPDILVGQIEQHAFPLDRFSELSCLTAMTFDGEILWQKGTPNADKWELTNDVAFQIVDFDGDGKNEAVFTMNCTIWVVDGATGEVKYSAPTPAKKGTVMYMDDPKQVIKTFDRILGDCLFFWDMNGTGKLDHLLIKDRYEDFWIYDNKLNFLWKGSCRTGHYPYAKDLNGDGYPELLIGYSCYDRTGKQLWSWDKEVQDHCDGVAATDMSGGEGEPKLRISNAASDEGFIIADANGNIIKRHRIGHSQNPAIANLRPDLSGLETVVVNFWGNQGIIHILDSDGNILHDFEPSNYGSMCMPLNWKGDGQEYFVLNPSVREGGVFDGWGRKVLAFPEDGHPDMCNATLNITGDCRDEIVVWDMNSIWVYTQDNNQLEGKLYKPVRNSLSNYSNYQLTVSDPGWSE